MAGPRSVGVPPRCSPGHRSSHLRSPGASVGQGRGRAPALEGHREPAAKRSSSSFKCVELETPLLRAVKWLAPAGGGCQLLAAFSNVF